MMPALSVGGRRGCYARRGPCEVMPSAHRVGGVCVHCGQIAPAWQVPASPRVGEGGGENA